MRVENPSCVGGSEWRCWVELESSRSGVVVASLAHLEETLQGALPACTARVHDWHICKLLGHLCL